MKYTSLFLSMLACVLVTGCGKAPVAPITEAAQTAKIIQTQKVTKSSFNEQIHIIGKITPLRETVISTQGSGFVGSVSVKMGDRIVGGQTLATIADTYGLSANSLDEAALSITSTDLTGESNLSTLDQAVENARVALEKAKKDYESSKISTAGTSGTISKAELDLQNYITTQEKTLSGFETSYQNQIQIFQSFMANVIETTDTLIGVSREKENLNDSYEYLLGALDSSSKNKAESSVKKLLEYRTWTPDATKPLITRVQELQKVYTIVNDVLADVETMLIKSVSDATNFSASTLASQRAIIDGYQTQYSSISTGLVSYLNGAQSFLATYEKERLSREQGVKITAENSLNALELAQKTLATAEKNRAITGTLTTVSSESANIKLRNAQANAAKLTITAPYSGVVVAKNIEVGSLVSPGGSLFVIGDTARVIVKIEVGIDQQKYLKVGQNLTLTIGTTPLTAKLTSLSAGPDPQTKLYKGEITLPETGGPWTLGETVDVILPGAPISQNPADAQIVVPFSALKNLGQERYAVYVVDTQQGSSGVPVVHERRVKIGETNENSVTIVEGLTIGETIVSLGTLDVEDGDRVQTPMIDTPPAAE